MENNLHKVDSNEKKKIDGNPKVDYFHNKDGLLIKTYAWIVKNPVGVVILTHGLDSHIRLGYLKQNIELQTNGRAVLKDGVNFYVYKDSLIESLNQNNYSVYGLDLQGHGLSDGWKNVRCNINKFDDYVYDTIQYINRIHNLLCLSYNKNNSLSLHDNIINTKVPPFFLIGSSMGGNIVLRTLEILGKSKDKNNNNKINIKGCIVLAGMVSLENLESKKSFKYFYIPISKFCSTVFPTLRLIPKVLNDKYKYINDIDYFDKYKSNKQITCRLGRECHNAVSNLNIDLEYIPDDVHVLFVHSKCDTICSYNGTLSFYNKLNIPNKELYSLDDMLHWLLTEPGNEQVTQYVIKWILKKT